MHPQGRVGLTRVEWALGENFEDSRRPVGLCCASLSPLKQDLKLLLDIQRTLSRMMSSSCYREIPWTSTPRSSRTEENQLTYISTFNDYNSLVENYTEERLLEQIPILNTEAFTAI